MYRTAQVFPRHRQAAPIYSKIEDKKSYQNVKNKRDILEVAQKELETVFNEGQSDLYFTYRIKDKDGRKILSYWFDIHTRQTEEQKRLDFGTTQAQIRRYYGHLQYFHQTR